MWQTIVNAFKIKDVRRKILITIGLLFIYRLGCYIPVPGVNLMAGLNDYTFLKWLLKPRFGILLIKGI